MKTLRQLDILTILAQNDSYLSSNQLSETLEVSYKTIQTDINEIQEKLNDFKGAVLESKRGYGYQLVYESEEDKNRLLERIAYLKHLRGIENQTGLLLTKLVLEYDRLSLKTLEQLLEIKTSDLQPILEQANEFSNSFHLELIQKDDEIELVGDELYKRMLFLNLHLIHLENDIFMRLVNSMKPLAQKALSQPLYQQVKPYFSNIENEQIYYYQCLVQHRLIKQKTLTKEALEPLAIYQFNTQSIAIDTKDLEDRAFNYLVLAIDHHINYKILPITDRNLFLQVKRFFEQRLIGIEKYFKDINHLQDRVITYLGFLSFQNALGYRPSIIADFFKNEDFVIALELSSHLIYTLKSYLNFSASKENIYQLSFLFLQHFVDNLYLSVLNVDIYSTRSSLISYTLKRIITAEYGNRVSVNALKRKPDLEKYNLPRNLLITDDSKLFEKNEKGFILVEQDLLNSQNLDRLIKLNIIPKQYKIINFLAAFNPENFTHTKPFKNIGEVVQYTLEKHQIKRNEKETIRSIFYRERHNFSLTNNGLTMPRIYVDKDWKTPKIEVVLLKKPLVWNDHYIKLLFLILIPRDFKGITLLGNPLNQLQYDKDILARIYESQDYIEFIQTLSNYLQQL